MNIAINYRYCNQFNYLRNWYCPRTVRMHGRYMSNNMISTNRDFPCNNSSPIQASITKYGPKAQNTLLKVPAVLWPKSTMPCGDARLQWVNSSWPKWPKFRRWYFQMRFFVRALVEKGICVSTCHLALNIMICQHVLSLNKCNLCRCYSSYGQGNLGVDMAFIPKCHDIWTHIVVDKSTNFREWKDFYFD